MKKIILVASFFAAVMLMVPFTSTAGQAEVSVLGEEKLKEESLVGAVAGMDICGQFMNPDQAELPEWSIGDFWEYDLSMAVIIDLLIDVEIEIKVLRMEMKVIEITSDEYTLSIFGYLESLSVSGFNYFQYIPSKFVSGLAYIDKETLAMKNFSLSLEGDVKDLYNILDINFDIEFFMEFDPYLDFLDFPIAVGDAWNLETVIGFSINGTIINNGENTPIEYNFPDIEINEELAVVAEEEISVPAGDFNSFKISGQNFKTWYNSSEIGYVAKLSGDFPLGIANSNFYSSLDGLISTNFNYPENNAPAIPNIDGPSSGEAGEEYEYNVSTTDPNGEQVYYKIDWGDGTCSGWLGPNASGEEVKVKHTWEKKATYKIRAKAKDENGYQTAWSDPMEVMMPVNHPDGSQSSQQSGSPQSNQNQNSQPSANSQPLISQFLQRLSGYSSNIS